MGVGAELQLNLIEVEKGCYGEGRSLTDRQTGNHACRVREFDSVSESIVNVPVHSPMGWLQIAEERKATCF